ncbi:MAG: SprT family zinc-dependent metalloprotease, partial [Colwellia sp.]
MNMAATHLHTYKDIEYSLKKSERKTTSIYIERDGSVSVLAPAPFEHVKIEQIIEKKRSWIYRNLAEWEDLNRTRVHREYVNGESFLYLGRHYRLQLVDAEKQETPLVFLYNQFLLRKDAVEQAPEHFKQFYKTKLNKKLKERLKIYQPKMGVESTDVKVMELQNRWGSCTAKGVVNFHWKCTMLPTTVLDYVVVHELAHI